MDTGKKQKIRIKDLKPGMRMLQDVRCTKKFCALHEDDDLITSENTVLTNHDVRKMKEAIDCNFQESAHRFTKMIEVYDFIDEYYKNREQFRQVKVIEKDKGGKFLSLMTIHELKDMVDKYKDGLVDRISILYGEEPLYHVYIPDNLGEYKPQDEKEKVSQHEIEQFKSGMRDLTRDVYKKFELNIAKGKEEFPEDTINDVYNLIKESGGFFSRLLNSSMADHLLTARDALFEDIYSNACAVALMAAKIVQSQENRGLDKYVQPILAACLFMDTGLIVARHKGLDYKQHSAYSAAIYKKLLEAIASVVDDNKVAKRPLVITAKSLQVNLSMGIPIIVNHHERYDGSGYPAGKPAHLLNMEMDRLIGLVDEFYRLTGSTNYHCESGNIEYKDPLSNVSALNELAKQTKAGKFLKQDFDVLMKHVCPYPVFSIVELSTGEKAIVVDLKKSKVKPIVYGLNSCETLDLSLSRNRDIKIKHSRVNITKSTRKEKVRTKVSYIDETKSIEVELHKRRKKAEKFVKCPCPGDEHVLMAELPLEIMEEYKLGNCLDVRTKYLTCEEGHFSIVTLEPPDECNELTCDNPARCPIQGWQVFVEGFYSE